MKLRENWCRSWTLGWLEFEIEWVPKASYYVFSLTWNRSGER